ncbi:hypothetical protein EDB86DRAFT_1317772 [Lactarius hatsudake]|nr:hypothetical protein EDB86DRAFT_1317772 [Lactarius hatsudake]
MSFDMANRAHLVARPVKRKMITSELVDDYAYTATDGRPRIFCHSAQRRRPSAILLADPFPLTMLQSKSYSIMFRSPPESGCIVKMTCCSTYYRKFICFGGPPTLATSEEERNIAFCCGFHPEDREVIRPRFLGKNPFQPPDVPSHFEKVFGCARAAFAYGDCFPSPWLQELKFSIRRAVASNTETTATSDELPPYSHSTPDSCIRPRSRLRNLGTR